MVLILFSLCLWFASPLVNCSPPERGPGVLVFQKQPRHDKNWWLWNLEVKEKPLITSGPDKDDKYNHNLVYKRLANRPQRKDETILDNRPLKCHNVRKRWLSGGFGFGSKKNMNKESRKLQLNSESGKNNSSGTSDIQDLRMSKNKRVDQNRAETRVKKPSSRCRGGFKKRVHSQTKKKYFESHPSVSADNILFRSSALTDHMKHPPVDQRYQTRLPEPTLKTYYGDLQPLSKMYTPVWNKSYDAIYDRYVTPFTELKINPLKQPHPFFDPRSSIPWYTPLTGGRKVEPTRVYAQLQSMNEPVMSKDVAKSSRKLEFIRRRHRNEEIELIPKVYALSKLKDRKHLKKFSNNLEEFEPATNPIIVPGFKRKFKDIETTDDKTIRSFIVREQAPFEDEYIQVYRANRNQTKPDSAADDQKLPIGGPIQVPSPYGFPGGVNISILVPNVPAPLHEAPLITTISTEKNSKKKKERKKKIRDDDSLRDDLVSAPRSQVTQQGDDDLSNRGMELIKYGPLITGVKYPVFDFKADNFTLLNHIKNMTLDQVNWGKLFGLQTENAKKSELGYDDDDDEIRMLYDEQTSTANHRFTQKLMENTASFKWNRFLDHATTIPNERNGGKFRIVPNVVNSGDNPSDVTLLRNRLSEQYENRWILPTSKESVDLSKLNSNDKVSFASKDQWDVLDEDLKNIACGKGDEVVWRLKNRKREAVYDHDDDAQGYYRLSSGENSLRHPANMIISALRKKSDKHRSRDYDEELPEENLSERTRTGG